MSEQISCLVYASWRIWSFEKPTPTNDNQRKPKQHQPTNAIAEGQSSMTYTRINTRIDTRIVRWFPFFLLSSIWTVSRNEKQRNLDSTYSTASLLTHPWLYLRNSKTPKEQSQKNQLTNLTLVHTFTLYSNRFLPSLNLLWQAISTRRSVTMGIVV